MLHQRKLIRKYRESNAVYAHEQSRQIRLDETAMNRMIKKYNPDLAWKNLEDAASDRGRTGFLASVLENGPGAFVLCYPDGRLKMYNRAFLKLTGYTDDELNSKSWHEDLTPRNWQELETKIIENMRRTGQPQIYERECIRKDGSLLPVEVFIYHVLDEHGNILFYYLFINDITELRRLELGLQHSRENISNYVKELEQRNRETELFSEMVSLLQTCATVEEAYTVAGRLVGELFSTECGALYLFNPARNMLEQTASWGGEKPVAEQELTTKECWALRLGRIYLVDAGHRGMLCRHLKEPLQTASLCVPMTAQGETLGLLHIQLGRSWLSQPEGLKERQKRHKQQLAVAVAENVALALANFKLRDTLYIQSIHDYLTGLYNRRYMTELLEKELHRMARKKMPAGVIILDIDHFKEINDSFGHDAGDTVLREFSSFLRGHVREEDFACRFGGDEFVVILPETSLENANQRAEQLREGAKHLAVLFRGQTLKPITLSLGVAAFPNHGQTPDALLLAGDSALYRAKAEGRDRVVVA